ncbi:NAD-dependent epimerase/dehydratase family protein [Oleisolibacter albus]|uniref:NAD-dependent epimerase/dehydratase family protein n=1 Tax=Oleisolibacter albus TaxID=2171757 RepID=UPI000DF1D17A|nr:NAD-dependent epimerase/dehydratase family protein [Oleisolibacter albus]
MTGKRTALVLGATGGIGSAVTTRLLADGWTVRAMHRHAAVQSGRRGDTGGALWVQGDAMQAEDVRQAADGVSLLVHAVNPPAYRHWDRLVLPMLDNSIAAARAAGARLLLPGTVYNYGPDSFPLIAEDARQAPLTRKGMIRVAMERRLEQAAGRGLRVLIVRAGDFFGPTAGNSWFSQGLVKPGRPVNAITMPGQAGIGHQWAYLPDLAETMVRLLQQDARLDGFARFHFGGHWDPDGLAMIQAIRRVVACEGGRPDVPLRRLPWTLLRLISPVVPLCRELVEMRYLWSVPVQVDNRRLTAFLGTEPHTPLDQAVRTTLAGLGCLPPVSQPQQVGQVPQ